MNELELRQYQSDLRRKADLIDQLLTPQLNGVVNTPRTAGAKLHWTQDPKNRKRLLDMRRKQAKALKKTWRLKKNARTAKPKARTAKAGLKPTAQA